MKILKILVIGLFFTLHSAVWSDSTHSAKKEQMKTTLDTIQNIFSAYYAPNEWKADYFGWDLNSQIKHAKHKVDITDNITVKQFQYIVRDFFHSTKDYHVGVIFHSTESGTLPFTVISFEGRYFISHVDSSRLDQSVYPIFVGDELVTFDNQPIAEVIKDLKVSCTPNSNFETDETLAAFYLTHRSGELGHKVPKGSVVIGISSWMDDKINNIKLVWDYTPEKISNGFDGSFFSPSDSNRISNFLGEKHIYDQLMVLPSYQAIQKLCKKTGPIKAYEDDDDDDGDPDDSDEMPLGYYLSKLPALGKIWWESSLFSPYDAYIYETEDHKLIGFLRIPHYMGGSFDVEEEFAPIISLFEERTDALVLDQMDNPGGLLFYAYGLLSMLTDRPLSIPKERIKITQEEVAVALSVLAILEDVKSNNEAQSLLGTDVDGMPVTYQMIQRLMDFFSFIVDQWNAGRHFTESCSLLGFEEILPHPSVHYTKPILLLINSMDFSCGDYFPAIMQDNQRALLMGTRTAGAGGFVTPYAFPNAQGMMGFALTGSIAERLDNQPIENLGVRPDVDYQPTLDDIMFGYSDFAEKVNAVVAEMLEVEEAQAR